MSWQSVDQNKCFTRNVIPAWPVLLAGLCVLTMYRMFLHAAYIWAPLPSLYEHICFHNWCHKDKRMQFPTLHLLWIVDPPPKKNSLSTTSMSAYTLKCSKNVCMNTNITLYGKVYPVMGHKVPSFIRNHSTLPLYAYGIFTPLSQGCVLDVYFNFFYLLFLRMMRFVTGVKRGSPFFAWT